MSAARVEESLLSPDWYRIAFMRPRLRPGVSVTRQPVRDQTWFVLSDPVSGRHHRVNDIAYGLIACCDGRRSLDEIWAARVECEGEDAPTQGEAIRVFIEAFRANLFVGDVAPDAQAVVGAHVRERRRRRRAAINPFAFSVPLWDPDAWLERPARFCARLFGVPAQLLAWLVIAAGAALFAVHAPAIFKEAGAGLASGRLLLVMWLIFPFIKAVHELAHALAVKAFGGEVHEIGLSLLLLTPVPYVDASASVAFPARSARVIVAAVGVAVEALLATLALCAWLALEPGLAREVALAVVLIGGVSSVLVNGNPFMRLDGYHVLTEVFQLPNLAGRSQRHWLDLIRRSGLRMAVPESPVAGRGEHLWLIAYAPLAWLCRVALLLALAIAMAATQSTLGWIVLVLGGVLAVGWPFVRAVLWLARASELTGQRARVAARVVVGLMVVVAALLWIPLPDRSHAPAVVWVPDDALIRVAADGFVEAWLVADGQRVDAGAPLLQLRNPVLKAELAGTRAKIAEQEIARAGALATDPKRAAMAADELGRLAATEAIQAGRLAALTLHAGREGRVALDARRLRVGQFLAQGAVVGHLLDEQEAPLVRALVSNEDVAAVRGLLREGGGITVALASGEPSLAAVVERAVPQGGTALPTAALGERAGGAIPVAADDPAGLTAREPRFVFDLRLAALPAGAHPRVGTRALADFRAGTISPWAWFTRHARRLLLRHFER